MELKPDNVYENKVLTMPKVVNVNRPVRNSSALVFPSEVVSERL